MASCTWTPLDTIAVRDDVAAETEELVTLRIDCEAEGARFLDTVLWSVKDRITRGEQAAEDAEIRGFCDTTCRELGHGSAMREAMGSAIAAQICAHRELRRQVRDAAASDGPPREDATGNGPGGAESRKRARPDWGEGKAEPTFVKLRVGLSTEGVVYCDEVLWDLNDTDTSPEAFASATVRDLSLPAAMASSLAASIREQLLFLRVASRRPDMLPYLAAPVEEALVQNVPTDDGPKALVEVVSKPFAPPPPPQRKAEEGQEEEEEEKKAAAAPEAKEAAAASSSMDVEAAADPPPPAAAAATAAAAASVPAPSPAAKAPAERADPKAFPRVRRGVAPKAAESWTRHLERIAAPSEERRAGPSPFLLGPPPKPTISASGRRAKWGSKTKAAKLAAAAAAASAAPGSSGAPPKAPAVAATKASGGVAPAATAVKGGGPRKAVAGGREGEAPDARLELAKQLFGEQNRARLVAMSATMRGGSIANVKDVVQMAWAQLPAEQRMAYVHKAHGILQATAKQPAAAAVPMGAFGVQPFGGQAMMPMMMQQWRPVPQQMPQAQLHKADEEKLQQMAKSIAKTHGAGVPKIGSEALGRASNQLLATMSDSAKEKLLMQSQASLIPQVHAMQKQQKPQVQQKQQKPQKQPQQQQQQQAGTAQEATPAPPKKGSPVPQGEAPAPAPKKDDAPPQGDGALPKK